MNHFYMSAASTWGNYESMQRMMDRDAERGIDYTVHWHYEGEPCVAKCATFING